MTDQYFAKRPSAESRPVDTEFTYQGHTLRLTTDSGVFSEMTAVISLIIAAVGLVLVFVGMYAHVVMFLNIVLCLVGVGFGIAALIGRASTRFLGIFGITGCVLDILIQIICMIVVAITSGISAVFHLLT